MVAACTIEQGCDIDSNLINDSKKLSEKERQDVFDKLTNNPKVHYSIATVSVETIDEINILQATFLGMDQVIADLCTRKVCDYSLVDGPHLPPKSKLSMKGKILAVKGGDAKVRAIGASSILAKVTRDRLMCKYDKEFPVYKFAQHKGYGVKTHMEMLRKHGPCTIHRTSFGPVRRALEQEESAQ